MPGMRSRQMIAAAAYFSVRRRFALHTDATIKRLLYTVPSTTSHTAAATARQRRCRHQQSLPQPHYQVCTAALSSARSLSLPEEVTHDRIHKAADFTTISTGSAATGTSTTTAIRTTQLEASLLLKLQTTDPLSSSSSLPLVRQLLDIYLVQNKHSEAEKTAVAAVRRANTRRR